MADASDPLEILDAIDRERGESSIGMIQANQVQRLRDEIVALRKLTDGDWVWKQITDTRDAALEEAASIAQRTKTVEGRETAIAIRKLKGLPLVGSAASGSHG